MLSLAGKTNLGWQILLQNKDTEFEVAINPVFCGGANKNELLIIGGRVNFYGGVRQIKKPSDACIFDAGTKELR